VGRLEKPLSSPGAWNTRYKLETETELAIPNALSAREVLGRVADRTRRFDFTVWFWGDPIAFDGLLEATTLLGEPRYAEHAEKYLRPWC